MNKNLIKPKIADIQKELKVQYQLKEIEKKLYPDKYLDDTMLEIINVTFICDKDYLLREPNQDYIKRELEWYKSMSLNVNDIPGEVPKIWQQVSDKDGFINSNYGWCIYHQDNFNQYNKCLYKLQENKNTRQAQMIYTRPSIQQEWNKNGMKDMMCTNYVQVFIRENKLIYCVYQRSCDAVFGFGNDYAWHKYVYNNLFNDLKSKYIELEQDYIQYTCGSLHVYPMHQHLLKDLKIIN